MSDKRPPDLPDKPTAAGGTTTPDRTGGRRPLDLEPMGGAPGLASTMDVLLRKPGTLVFEFQEGENAARLVRHLLLGSVVCLAVFGFLLGTFSMGQQLWVTPVKVVCGVLASALICLPSLYIFSCLSGLEIRFRPLVGLLLAALCLISLVLVGFAPVLWVFAQSTHSTLFMGVITLGFWLIAVWVGLSLLNRAAEHFGATRRAQLHLWGLVFVFVSLQMSTTLRPIIGEAEAIVDREKKSFLIYWGEQLEDASKSKRVPPSRPESP